MRKGAMGKDPLEWITDTREKNGGKPVKQEISKIETEKDYSALLRETTELFFKNIISKYMSKKYSK